MAKMAKTCVCVDYGSACKAGRDHRSDPVPLHPKDGIKLTLTIKLGSACHMLCESLHEETYNHVWTSIADSSECVRSTPEAEVQEMFSRDVGSMALLQGRPGQGTMLLPC